MSDKAVSRESDKFMLRLPDGMRERIKAEADRNGRSMNAEIVAALDQMYPAPPEDMDLLDFSLRWVVPIRSAKTPEEARVRFEEANRAATGYYPGQPYTAELVLHEIEDGVGLSLVRTSERSSFRVLLTRLAVVPAGYTPASL